MIFPLGVICAEEIVRDHEIVLVENISQAFAEELKLLLPALFREKMTELVELP